MVRQGNLQTLLLFAVLLATVAAGPLIDRSGNKLVRYPGVLLFAFLLLFESGNEAAMIGWTSTWAGAKGAGARTATLVLARFQAAMMLGRIGASRVLRAVREEQLVFGSALARVIIMAQHLPCRCCHWEWSWAA